MVMHFVYSTGADIDSDFDNMPQSRSGSIACMPFDIFLLVVDQIHDRRDLASLRLCCSSFSRNSLITSRLYSTIDVAGHRYVALNAVVLRPCFRAAVRAINFVDISLPPPYSSTFLQDIMATIIPAFPNLRSASLTHTGMETVDTYDLSTVTQINVQQAQNMMQLLPSFITTLSIDTRYAFHLLLTLPRLNNTHITKLTISVVHYEAWPLPDPAELPNRQSEDVAFPRVMSAYSALPFFAYIGLHFPATKHFTIQYIDALLPCDGIHTSLRRKELALEDNASGVFGGHGLISTWHNVSNLRVRDPRSKHVDDVTGFIMGHAETLKSVVVESSREDWGLEFEQFVGECGRSYALEECFGGTLEINGEFWRVPNVAERLVREWRACAWSRRDVEVDQGVIRVSRRLIP